MRRRTVFLILLSCVLALSAFALSGCNKSEEATLSSIKINTLPQQYYIVGEAFSVDGGSLTARYSDGTEKTVLMTSSEVEVRHAGTNIDKQTNVATVTYGGFETKYKYRVDSDDIIGVTLDSSVIETAYAVSNLRIEPEFNTSKVTINYGNGTSNTEYLFDMTAVRRRSMTEGFDVSKEGYYTFKFNYFATTFELPYQVFAEDWIVSTQFLNSNTVRTTYLIGEAVDIGTASVLYTYNSLKTEADTINKDIIVGFDTATVGARRMTLVADDTTVCQINYNVYDKSDDSALAFASNSNNGFYVNADLNYDDFLSGITLHAYYSETDYTVLNANDADINVRYKLTKEGDYANLTESIFDNLKTKGQVVYLQYTYMGNIENCCYSSISIIKRWVETQLANTDTIRTSYVSGETFSFGTATLTKIYDDGTTDVYDLQEEYLKAKDKRSININDLNAVPVATFDMTASQTQKYYIVVTQDFSENGRYYINYTVA